MRILNKPMNRLIKITGRARQAVLLAITGSTALASPVVGEASADKPTGKAPNIITILIDDLAYGDIGAFGCPDIPTPHIDSLVKEGVRFLNGYTMCPVCSPSRAGLMTGLYPQRFGVYGNGQRGVAIPTDHPTMAEALRDAGYVTGMVGRWDLGSRDQGPLERGFMKVATGAQSMPLNSPGRAIPTFGPTYLLENGGYLTDLQGDKLVDFVEKHKSDRFFLYFAPLAVHYPVKEVPKKYLDRVPESVKGRTKPVPRNPRRASYTSDRRTLAASIIALDDAIGRLLASLKQHNLDENTLIFFASDNGGWEEDGARNAPWRGGKGTTWNGAVHVPFAVRWKGTLPAGRDFKGLACTLDIYATAVAAAGIPASPRLDGVNLLPYQKGEKSGDPHKSLFWRFAGQQDLGAVRMGPWRLQRIDDALRLSNLDDDPGESRDVSNEHPELVETLLKHLVEWERTLPPAGKPDGPAGRMPPPGSGGWAVASPPEAADRDSR